jgi:hypothetical protein
MGKTEGSKVKT